MSVPTAAALKMGVGFPLNNLIPGRKDDGKILSTQCPNNEELMNECGICKRCTDQHLLAKCDTCHLYYHLGCLNPPLTRHPKKSKLYGWQCSECDKSDDSGPERVIIPKAPRRSRIRYSKDGSIIQTPPDDSSFNKSNVSTDIEGELINNIGNPGKRKIGRTSTSGNESDVKNGHESRAQLASQVKVVIEKVELQEIGIERAKPTTPVIQVQDQPVNLAKPGKSGKPGTPNKMLVNSHDPITVENEECQKKPEDPIKIEEKPKKGRKKKEKRTLTEISQDLMAEKKELAVSEMSEEPKPAKIPKLNNSVEEISVPVQIPLHIETNGPTVNGDFSSTTSGHHKHKKRKDKDKEKHHKSRRHSHSPNSDRTSSKEHKRKRKRKNHDMENPGLVAPVHTPEPANRLMPPIKLKFKTIHLPAGSKKTTQLFYVPAESEPVAVESPVQFVSEEPPVKVVSIRCFL
jgi:hypothetical protein